MTVTTDADTAGEAKPAVALEGPKGASEAREMGVAIARPLSLCLLHAERVFPVLHTLTPPDAPHLIARRPLPYHCADR
jgi:hypothetical protein